MFLVSRLCCGTSYTCIAHWYRPNSQQQLHKRTKQRTTAIIISRTVIWCCPRGPIRCPVGDGVPPRIQYTQITLQHELQFHVSHNGHIRHRPSCLICTLPTQHPPCFSWRRRTWLARQDVGWQWRSNFGVVWGHQRCADWKIPSALVHGVWPKIHVCSPQQYAVFTLQLVCVWMFPYTHSTHLYDKMPSYTRRR